MKIKVFSFLFLSLLLFACTSDTQGGGDIEKLEQALEADPNVDNAQALVDAYKAYIEANPNEIEQNSKFLYRAASVQFRMNRFSSSEALLKEAVKDYYASSNTSKNALFLATVYDEKLRNTASATTVYQGLAQAFGDTEEGAKAKAKLDASLPGLEQRVEALGQSMFNDSTNRIEYRIANDYINSCELYAMLLPDSESSPSFLHKAGETARSIRIYKKALEIYEWIGAKYPNFEKAPQSLFLRAFTLDNDLKRFDEAKVLYEEFLQKYPNDDFADDTKFLLENLGKDDEEIINNFNQNQ